MMSNKPQNEPQFDVVVIGAGAAGLSAARELVRQGKSVVLLEGRNRYGGRVFSQNIGAGVIDLGAGWISFADTPDNPMPPMPIALKLKRFTTVLSNICLYDSLRGKEAAKLSEAEVQDILSTAASLSLKPNTEKETSILLAVDWSKLFPNDPDRQARQRKIEFVKYLLTNWTAAPLDLLHKDISETMPWVLNQKSDLIDQGYVSVMDQLAEGLNIQYNHVVESIEYSPAGVKIGVSKSAKQWFAKCAIVTVPLGVLKRDLEKEKSMFVPELPAGKQKAIQDLGMGLLNKVVFRFPDDSLWAQDNDYDFIGYIGETPGDNFLILNISRHKGEPIIVVFFAANYAAKYEELSDEEMKEKVLSYLDTFYPGASNPQLASQVEVVVTRWGKDEMSYGSYSFLSTSVGSLETYEELGRSIKSLFFAGEATEPTYNGLVQGAYLSGERAAREVAEYLAS